MFKRLMMVGLLGVSLTAILAAEANAQISGWGWFGFSSIRGEITTEHTPPPQGQPSTIQAMVTATIQIACKNPATNGVFNGVAFHRSLTSSTPLGEGNITDNGETTTEVLVSLDQFEVPTNCPNRKWTPIVGSAMAVDFSGNVFWCLVDKTGQTNCSAKKNSLLDSSSVTCTLDTAAFPRNSDGTAPHDAVFSCSSPQ
jgi:hypothetical protein